MTMFQRTHIGKRGPGSWSENSAISECRPGVPFSRSWRRDYWASYKYSDEYDAGWNDLAELIAVYGESNFRNLYDPEYMDDLRSDLVDHWYFDQVIYPDRVKHLD